MTGSAVDVMIVVAKNSNSANEKPTVTYGRNFRRLLDDAVTRGSGRKRALIGAILRLFMVQLLRILSNKETLGL